MYQRSAQLQSILVSYAPNSEMSDVCDRIYQRMVSDNLPETDIERQIVGALADGLYHGNWPWVNGNNNFRM